MRRTRLRLLFAVLTVSLLPLFIGALSWGQGSDTPIVVSDGSLTIESRGVPWSRYTTTGNSRHHPEAGKAVTAVDLTVNGRQQTISFSGEPCTVTAQYGNTTITISTGTNGRGLQVSTDFSVFHPGSSANHIAHNNASNHMSLITVRKGNNEAFRDTGNGGSVITVHYR